RWMDEPSGLLRDEGRCSESGATQACIQWRGRAVSLRMSQAEFDALMDAKNPGQKKKQPRVMKADRQREAIGEYFYVHDFAPGLAFPSQGQAVSRAHRNVVAQAIKDGLPVPVAVLVQYPDLSRLQTI